MKKFLKVVLMLTLVMSLAIPLASCGGSGENKDSKKDETLVVGMEPTFPPFDAQDKKGNFEGFDVDLINIADPEPDPSFFSFSDSQHIIRKKIIGV